MAKRIDIDEYIGNRYGRLTAIKFAGRTERGRLLFDCKCDCGAVVTVYHSNLQQGLTKSCGCLHRERITTHGESKVGGRARLYNIWSNISQRCHKEYSPQYADYGGRGITMCDEWRTSYETFRDWAMNNGYADRLTIDRIDVNGNYEPDNCRWATYKEQNRNRRNNIIVTYNGATAPLSEWTERLGLPYGATVQRIYRGWSVEKAFTMPVRKKAKNSA